MLLMILKMSAVTAGHIFLTFYLWRFFKDKEINWGYRMMIAAVFGGLAVLSTHFGVDYNDMLLNIRDLAPLTAGLFFDPIAGIFAGFIGGIERYIAGTYFGIGSYTRVACALSTCLSGVVAALLKVYIFKGKKPPLVFSYFIGSTMEVFHMYVVFITHRDDMNMAYYVVKTCSPGMIIFTGIGLTVISLIISVDSGEWVDPKKYKDPRNMRISQRFQIRLLAIISVVLIMNLIMGNIIQTQVALQKSNSVLSHAVADIGEAYNQNLVNSNGFGEMSFSIGERGGFELFQTDGRVLFGVHRGRKLTRSFILPFWDSENEKSFFAEVFGTRSMCMTRKTNDGNTLLVYLSSDEVFKERNHSVYENILADILLFTVIYILVTMLVQKLVVENLEEVNVSLRKITEGNLDESVSVYTSSEFTSVSNDINQTVDVLKTYIKAAEQKYEEELEFAKSIQDSALPHNFSFPRTDLELYASMDAAKEVGGDFYDFFFVDANKICLVIADVSGKGIPAALFMMKSKAILRNYAESGKSPAEICKLANNGLCEGNDAEMFVTVWISIIDLETGHAVCSNAGHEYPIIKRANGNYELYKQKHNMALAVMKDIPFREYELDFKRGDCLFVYTDGIPEAINLKEESYGTGRLVDVLNKYKDLSQKDILGFTRQDIRLFVGKAEQFDDVTMIGFKYLGFTNN